MLTVLMSIALILALFVLWGLVEPYGIERVEHPAVVPNLPEEWRGRRFALISDLHAGMFLANTGTTRRIVARIVEERPDFVLVAGDFVHDTAQAAGRAAELLQPLTRAGIPTYAVLGNHDYAMPTRNDEPRPQVAAAVRDALQGIGVRLLENEAVALGHDGADGASDAGPLYLVGIGAHLPRRDDPKAALAGLPEGAARIALMHHPASFEAFPPHSAPFAVAGHTHGGQIHVPYLPLWKYLTYVKETKVYVGGWVMSGRIDGYGEAGNHLYINRGIGFSVAPLRVGCPPELTVFTLTRPA